jgi:regulator of protease activity HflC (stomatin/prohibitin superfamily)
MEIPILIVVVGLALLAIVTIARTATVVPQQSAYVIENLGKYSRTLHAGFHILIPFVERVAYKHSLKEQAVDVHEQICITKDNVQVGVDGVLYLQVLDPQRASYGITDYGFAISQLAQTTLRSEMGKIELDRTFEERGTINASVVSELDKASAPWGVKVLRYEIKNINPPAGIVDAMEKQMRAEREKRAIILASEGERDARINTAEGEKQRVIKESEANRQQQINEAQGEAEAILAVARATAEGLTQIAVALQSPGGDGAMRLRIAEQYIQQFGNLAKQGNTFVVPANLSDLAGMLTLASTVLRNGSPVPPRG